VVVLAVCFVYLAYDNGMEKCQENYSYDTCVHILR